MHTCYDISLPLYACLVAMRNISVSEFLRLDNVLPGAWRW